MFLEVYTNKKDMRINTFFIRSKDIKNIYFDSFFKTTGYLYTIKVETYDSKNYIVIEDVCIKEAQYFTDKLIDAIEDKENDKSKIDLYEIHEYFEKNSFYSYYLKGKLENNDKEEKIIDTVLENVPDNLENDLTCLCGTARKELNKQDLDIFLNLISRYEHILEEECPDLFKYYN